MIHKNFNFSVNIRAGLNGPILQEYDSEEGRVSRSIEAVTDTILCTQITLHKDFEWFDADGLYVGIRYGSRDYQIELWIPKDLATPSSDENKWSLQIPGTNILDTATNRSMGCRYRFAELEVSDLYSKRLEKHILPKVGHVKSITEQRGSIIAVDRQSVTKR